MGPPSATRCDQGLSTRSRLCVRGYRKLTAICRKGRHFTVNGAPLLDTMRHATSVPRCRILFLAVPVTLSGPTRAGGATVQSCPPGGLRCGARCGAPVFPGNEPDGAIYPLGWDSVCLRRSFRASLQPTGVSPVAEGTAFFAVVGHRGAAVVELAYGIPHSRAHCRSRTLGRCRLGPSEEGVNFLLRVNFMLRSVLPPKIVVE